MRRLPILALSCLLLSLAGCATLSGEATQPISVHTVDAEGRPINGMRCRLANDAAHYFGNSPLRDVQVRRSGSDLSIECRLGERFARATAVSRSQNAGIAMLPGGTVAMLVDHATGYAYAYPRTMQLQIGASVVFDDHAPLEPSARTATY